MIPTTIFRAFKPELRDTNLPAGVIGQVAGIAVVFNELDDYGTMFGPTSLDRTIRERVAAGKVKLYWDHGDAPLTGMYDSDLHIGTVRSIEKVQLPTGQWAAYMVADIFDTPKGREAKQYLHGVLASGGETGLSVGGRSKGIKSELVKIDGQDVERFTEFPLREISITSMQAVPNSTVLAVRATLPQDADELDTESPSEDALEPMQQVKKARGHVQDAMAVTAADHPAMGHMQAACDTLMACETQHDQAVTRAGKTASVDGVEHPAKDFAYVPDPNLPSTWKFPIFDADHARNALARFDQADLPAEDKAKVYAKIVAACNKFGIDVTNPKAHRATTVELGTMSGTITWGTCLNTNGTVFLSPVQDQAAALRALLRSMPENIIRAEVRAFIGNATTEDSDADESPSSDSDATAEDSQPTDQSVVYATMDERSAALRSLYRKAV